MQQYISDKKIQLIPFDVSFLLHTFRQHWIIKRDFNYGFKITCEGD